MIVYHRAWRAAIGLFASLAVQIAPPTPTADAVSTAREVDFGSVTQGALVRQAFDIAGVPTGARISRVEVDQPGLAARFRVTAADQQPRVRLEWNTSRVEGPVEGTARVLWEDAAIAAATLVLRGKVKPAFDISPNPAFFFSTFVGEPKTDMLTVTVNGETAVTIDRVEPQGTHFRAALKTVETGRRYELSVTVPPDAAPGRFRERVVLHTSHPAAPTFAIPVNVLVKPDVFANPETIAFGNVSIGAARQPTATARLTQTVIVRRRQGPFELTGVSTDLRGFALSRDPAEGKSEAFRIDLSLDASKLTAGETLTGTLTIRTDDARFPEIRVPITGTTVP